MTVDGLESASFETQSALLKSIKSAFVPFSEGSMACPGRRYAQVETRAALSLIFWPYLVSFTRISGLVTQRWRG
jgi:hypothetical protein